MINPALEDYIKRQKDRGFGNEDIAPALKEQGWSDEVIAEALSLPQAQAEPVVAKTTESVMEPVKQQASYPKDSFFVRFRRPVIIGAVILVLILGGVASARFFPNLFSKISLGNKELKDLPAEEIMQAALADLQSLKNGNVVLSIESKVSSWSQYGSTEREEIIDSYKIRIAEPKNGLENDFEIFYQGNYENEITEDEGHLLLKSLIEATSRSYDGKDYFKINRLANDPTIGDSFEYLNPGIPGPIAQEASFLLDKWLHLERGEEYNQQLNEYMSAVNYIRYLLTSHELLIDSGGIVSFDNSVQRINSPEGSLFFAESVLDNIDQTQPMSLEKDQNQYRLSYQLDGNTLREYWEDYFYNKNSDIFGQMENEPIELMPEETEILDQTENESHYDEFGFSQAYPESGAVNQGFFNGLLVLNEGVDIWVFFDFNIIEDLTNYVPGESAFIWLGTEEQRLRLIEIFRKMDSVSKLLDEVFPSFLYMAKIDISFVVNENLQLEKIEWSSSDPNNNEQQNNNFNLEISIAREEVIIEEPTVDPLAQSAYEYYRALAISEGLLNNVSSNFPSVDNQWPENFDDFDNNDDDDLKYLGLGLFNRNSSNPSSADNYWSQDSDNDGLTNLEELLMGTDPNNPDTDGDGFLDGDEVRALYNPLGPGRLHESPFISRYTIASSGHEFLYPKFWRLIQSVYEEEYEEGEKEEYLNDALQDNYPIFMDPQTFYLITGVQHFDDNVHFAVFRNMNPQAPFEGSGGYSVGENFSRLGEDYAYFLNHNFKSSHKTVVDMIGKSLQDTSWR
ncbi:MAG: hypothetical protein QY321_03095 [Patescibacteria group bacterium]|nr:MAG: hypothetical protein QY321_03095 [Patescibacteria group bacterium]